MDKIVKRRKDIHKKAISLAKAHNITSHDVLAKAIITCVEKSIYTPTKRNR